MKAVSNPKTAPSVSFGECCHMIAVAHFDRTKIMEQFMGGPGKYELTGIGVKAEVESICKNTEVQRSETKPR